MKNKFSRKWKASKKPSKQRKYAANVMNHMRKRLVSAHLSAELRKKHGKRSVPLRKGDKVKISRGQFRKKEGKVERVDAKNKRIYITGIEFVKKDGSKALYPVTPSNLVIQELFAEDKKRLKTTGGKPA
jgi:large subunit ribosomal protein L24